MRFSVLIEFFVGFSVLDDFFYGFAVSNRPQCPPSKRNLNNRHFESKILGPRSSPKKPATLGTTKFEKVNVQRNKIAVV